MSRIETNQFASQDDLPPEILRRLQVEELWARRNVLAELMNAERLQVYAQRCTDLAAGCAPMDVGSRDKLPRLAATVIPMRNRKSFAPVALSLGGAGLEMSQQAK
jgi:hypothetical protein